MRIIVCAKQIRHTYARTGNSPESVYINPEDSIFRIDPRDESALELALRLKDGDDNVTVTLLTLGGMIAESALCRCLATGADDLYQITGCGPKPGGDPLDQPDPWIKSGLLAKAVNQLQANLVLCGSASLDRGNGQVAALLARRLDRPFVSAITELAPGPDNDLQVQRGAGRGVREIIASPMPAVMSVEGGPELRLPTFEGHRKADAASPIPLAFGAEEEIARLHCQGRCQPRPRPKIIPPPDSRLPAYERVMQLLSGSKVEKKGDILTGSPETQAAGIIAFLKEGGFLPSTNDKQQQ